MKRINPYLMIAGIILMAFAICGSCAAQAQPLPLLTVRPSCTQVYSTDSIVNVAYSGKYVLENWQWGFIAFDSETGVAHYRNGVYKADPGFCQGKVRIVGDCWQSATAITASPDVPKWLLITGAPDMCREYPGERDDPKVAGLAVWKFDERRRTFEWHGLIRHPRVSRLAVAILDGDVAYQEKVDRGQFVKYDLNAQTVVDFAGTPPVGVRQQNVQGYTYHYRKLIDPNDPRRLNLDRSDVVQPTGTPVPTRSATATPRPGTPTRTPTSTKTGTPGPCYHGAPCLTPSRTPTVAPPTPTRTSTSVPPTPAPERTVLPPSTPRPSPQPVTPRPTATASSTPSASPTNSVPTTTATAAAPTPTLPPASASPTPTSTKGNGCFPVALVTSILAAIFSTGLAFRR